MNLLVFKVSPLGENIVFVPIVQQLRRMFPSAGLTLFTSRAAVPLYSGTLAPTRIVAVDRAAFNGSWKTPFIFSRFWWEARRTRARACLLAPDQGTVAHALAQLTVAGVRVGSGELKLSLPLRPTQTVVCPTDAKISEWNWEMGRALAAALGRYDWPKRMPPPDLSHLITRRPKTRPRIVVHAGAPTAYKRWPLTHFVETVTSLANDHEIVWLDDRATEEAVLPPAVLRTSADFLPEVSSWLASADLFLTNHAALLQLASAIGCPSVALSGPTHPEWDPTWKPERHLVLRAAKVPCLPCETHWASPERCTHQSPLICLQQWRPAEVERWCREWCKRWQLSPKANTPAPFA